MFGSKFTPRLEELGARITPSIKAGTGDFAQVADAGHISPGGAKLGIGSGTNADVVGHGAWVGGVNSDAIKPGGSDF